MDDESTSTFALFLTFFLIGLAVCAAGIYLVRGQGPTTASVRLRQNERREAAEKAEQKIAEVLRRSPATSTDATAAARVNAIADPRTAEALQNLQNLLYTRAITDTEFQLAKDNLLGAAEFAHLAHLAKLAELHQANILSDFEFAAAKAKALGLV
ncbi:MAG: hypothetical protein ACT4P1_13100 [Sporichthyaceae bacterium]